MRRGGRSGRCVAVGKVLAVVGLHTVLLRRVARLVAFEGTIEREELVREGLE